MCIEIANNNMNANLEVNTSTTNTNNKKKLTYSVKKLLKQIFKQTAKCERKTEINEQILKQSTSMESLESLESLDNQRNASIETECASLESYENEVNERRLSSSNSNIELEDCDIAEINACSMPVRFVRSAHGTFFWTAGASDWAVDNDLIEPLYCCTANLIAVPQDRWAQA